MSDIIGAGMPERDGAIEDILETVYSVPEDLAGDYQFGLHCGVEDCGITDRYEAADYGYRQALAHVWSILRHAFPDSSPGAWAHARAASPTAAEAQP